MRSTLKSLLLTKIGLIIAIVSILTVEIQNSIMMLQLLALFVGASLWGYGYGKLSELVG